MTEYYISGEMLCGVEATDSINQNAYSSTGVVVHDRVARNIKRRPAWLYVIIIYVMLQYLTISGIARNLYLVYQPERGPVVSLPEIFSNQSCVFVYLIVNLTTFVSKFQGSAGLPRKYLRIVPAFL